MDAHLRELERRFRASGSREDELAYRRQCVRQSIPGAQLRLDVAQYEREPVRARVAEVMTERLRALTKPHKEWKTHLASELDAALRPLLGSWWQGLGSGFGAEHFCACHKLVGYDVTPAQVDLASSIAGVVAHVEFVHAFHEKLFALFDSLALPEEPLALVPALKDALRKIVALVVDETGCDDAWYVKPHQALALLVEEKQFPISQQALDSLHAFSGTFESWIAPDAEHVEVAADVTVLALLRSRFVARYGSAGGEAPAVVISAVGREGREVLLAHLLGTLAMSWQEPPTDLAALLPAVSALEWRESDHDRYRATVDAPAHRNEVRDAGYCGAIAEVRALADEGATLDFDLMRRVQATVLGGSAPFRSAPAVARSGAHVYGWFEGLEGLFCRKIAVDAQDGCHPLIQACRLYLDIIFVHPFADGNARAARLWFEFLTRRARLATPPLEDLVRFEKVPGDLDNAWRFVRVAAKRTQR